MEKKDKWRNKRTIEEKKGLSTIHLKNWVWEKSSVSKRGFQLKPIRHLGFGSETTCPSRGILVSAVKLSALAKRIWRIHSGFSSAGIWHRELKHFVEEIILVADWVRKVIFFCGTSWGRVIFFLLGAPFCCGCVFPLQQSYSPHKSCSILLKRGPLVVISAGRIIFVAACSSSAGRVPSLTGCVCFI